MAVQFTNVDLALTKKELTYLNKVLKADPIGQKILAQIDSAAARYESDRKFNEEVIKRSATHADDIVTITCYGKTEKKKRSEALEFYRMCADNTDGCERERYLLIVDDLTRGFMTATDKRS